MGYAVRNDGLGWRVVNGPEEVGPDEYFSLTQPPPIDYSWTIYQQSARDALATSDRVVIRCYEDGMMVPDAWRIYRDALRAIAGATVQGDSSIPLPTPPDFPVYVSGQPNLIHIMNLDSAT